MDTTPRLLKDIGEFGLIRDVISRASGASVEGVLGIGDDCAIIPGPSDQEPYLVTTDMLVENIHFLRSRISPNELGRKTLSVNVSDIAAMGGTPRFALLSFSLPRKLDIAYMQAFMQGFSDVARECGVILIGGDTTKADMDMSISVTVIGSIARSNIKRRSDARVGDAVIVTGDLGDSGAGLRFLLSGRSKFNADEKHLIDVHNNPRAHLREGQWLASHASVHAMMDVSDGIASDLLRLSEQSRCGFDIDTAHLPISPTLLRVAHEEGLDPYAMAVANGEDFVLLATVAPESVDELARAFQNEMGRPLSIIGNVMDDGHGIVFRRDGKRVYADLSGHDHFHTSKN